MLDKVRKLFTKDDVFHVHKTLGVMALAHYVYRMLHIVQSGDSGLANSPYSVAFWVAVHGALSATSLLFHIPQNRVAKRPMIYPEFRAHSILFAWRGLLVMLCMTFVGGGWDAHCRAGVTLATFVGADFITRHYRAKDTTMRDMPFPEWMPDMGRKGINLFYSISQIYASMNMLYATKIDQVFLVAFPIQLAAFLMTLVRKGLLSAGGWHGLYAAALGLNYVYGMYWGKMVAPLPYRYLGTGFAVLRFVLRINKYALWMPLAALYCAGSLAG